MAASRDRITTGRRPISVVRTTTTHLGPAKYSRRRRCISERLEVAPVIFAADWVSLVRSCIGGIDFGRSVASKERRECLIDEFGISGSSMESASVIEQGAVNSRTDPSASHAMTMPRSRHRENTPGNGRSLTLVFLW